MNNIVSNYQQILDNAKSLKVPLLSQRAIIREYLQCLVISSLYSNAESSSLSFVGGTCLRLLRNLDRFSEDLDFDNLGLSDAQIASLIAKAIERLRRENIGVELHESIKEYKNYYELRFPNLLFDLKITTNDKEKLMIKFDYSSFWKKQKPETVLFSKYGFIEHVVTNPIGQMLVQKLAAYIQRKETQPRDLYDIVWLFAQGARLDRVFMMENNLENVVERAFEKLSKEGITRQMKARLQPFLFSPDSVKQLSFAKDVLESLKNN